MDVSVGGINKFHHSLGGGISVEGDLGWGAGDAIVNIILLY